MTGSKKRGVWLFVLVMVMVLGSALPVCATGVFPADGFYLVEVALWHETLDQPSMGDQAFQTNRRALAQVKNGRVTQVEFAANPVDIGGYHSGITELRSDAAPALYELETGQMVTSPAGNRYNYIMRAAFTLPEEAQPAESAEPTSIRIQFLVPDTPMGNQYMTGRLRLIWRSALATDETHLTVQTENAKKDSLLEDAATGIRLTAGAGRLGADARLSVKSVTDGEEYTRAKAALAASGNFRLFWIRTDAGGQEAAPQGQVTLAFPCGTEPLVYRMGDNGGKTVLTGTWADGYYTVNTSRLGLFALCDGSRADAFTDITGHWAADRIRKAVDRGLFSGVSDTLFAPEASMTRGMLVTVLGRLRKAEGKAEGVPFTDVKPSAWYAPYVGWACAHGLAAGKSATTFAPDDHVTRQELAVFLLRYTGYAGISLKTGAGSDYTDNDRIAGWAREAVERISAAGLLAERANHTFAPEKDATRAEVADALAHLIEDYAL